MILRNSSILIRVLALTSKGDYENNQLEWYRVTYVSRQLSRDVFSLSPLKKGANQDETTMELK